MRRSFKEHMRAFCLAHGYPYIESWDHESWSMVILDRFEIVMDPKQRGWFLMKDPVSGIACRSKSSAWELMCLCIEELLKGENGKKNS